MNDITALVQRLELAAAKGCCHTLLPDDCRALVEALEKAQRWERRWHQVATRVHEQACDSDVKIDELEQLLSDGVTEEALVLRERIAELESRTVTVKLASRRLPSDYVDGEFGNDDLAAIHNACRLECKVSVEKYLSAYGIVVKWGDE